MSMLGAGEVVSPKILIGFFWGLVALLCAMKCYAISKRPTTNTKCVLGLMCFFVGYCLMAMGGSIKLFGLPPLGAMVGLLFVYFVAFIAFAAAFVLPIIGLVEIRKAPQAYVQGKAQGIWALVLTSLFGCVMIGAAAIGFLSSQGLLDRKSNPGLVTLREDLNFRFTAPARPWVSMNAAKLNPDASVAYMRRNPDVCFVIIAEKFGGDAGITLNQLAEVGRSLLKGAASSSVELESENWTINGLSGLRVLTDGTVFNKRFSYCHWYCVTNGYAYQLIAWGENLRKPMLLELFTSASEGFQLADKNRVAPPSGAGFSNDFLSLGFPYKADVANSSWRKWASREADYPEAEFGASREGCCLAVVPVRLDGMAVEMDALIVGLLHTMNIKYPDDDLRDRTPLALSGMSGVQFNYKRQITSNEYLFRLRIIRTQGAGYLVVAWGDANKEGVEKILDDGLSRVHVMSITNALKTLRDPMGSGAINVFDRKTHASVMNSMGLYYFKKNEFDKALELFEVAVASDKSDVTYFKNALGAWNKLKQPRQALDYIEPRLRDYTNQLELLSWQAFFQGEAGEIALAVTNFSKIFSAGYDDENDFCDYIRLLLREGLFDEAQMQVDAYVLRHDSTTIRSVQAEVCRTRADYPKAVVILKQQHEKYPHNSRITTELIESELGAGFFKDALELCSGLVSNGTDSAYIWHLKGRSEYGLKWYREAKTSFEFALKRAPANVDTRNYLDHVSGLLGEGQNSAIKSVIEPVRLPPGLELGSKVSERKLATDSGAYYLRKIQAVSFDSNMASTTTDYLSVRVLDASGVSAFSTIQSTYDPLSEEIYVNEVRVMDATGKTVSTGRVADCYVLDCAGGNVSQKRVLNIPVPGLQVGNEVAVAITRRDIGKCDSFPFLEHVLSCSHPVQESILFIRAPTNSYRACVAGDISSRVIGDGQCWKQVEPPVIRYEPLQPDYSSFLPTIWVGDRSLSWLGLSSNYLVSIGDRLVADKDVDQLGRSIVQGVSDVKDQMAAIARYVQTNYTYKAIEFGRRARIPNLPGEIVRNKYGDCKDHSILVWHLLRAVGIPAQLALANVNTVVQKELPSLDQFNHMVVYVPSADGGVVIDATDKGGRLPDSAPYALLGKELFLLDGLHSVFVRINTVPANPPTLRAVRRIQVLPTGDVTVEETFVLGGCYGARWRSGLLGMASTARTLLLKQQLDLPATEVNNIQITDLDDPEKPLTFKCDYTIRNQFREVGGQLVGSLRTSLDRSVLAIPLVESRQTPFELRAPLAYEASIIVKAPAGFVIAKPRPERVAPVLMYLSWTFESGLEAEDQFKILITARQRTGVFRPSEYAAYRAEMNQVFSAVEAHMVLEQVRKDQVVSAGGGTRAD